MEGNDGEGGRIGVGGVPLEVVDGELADGEAVGCGGGGVAYGCGQEAASVIE